MLTVTVPTVFVWLAVAGASLPEPSRQVKSPDDLFHFVSPYENFPSANARSLGLKSIRREAVLVYYLDGKKQLATEAAGVLEKMHKEARRIAGFPISVHGLVLLESFDQLPADKRSHWLNIEGVACLVQCCAEQRLPLKSVLDNHMTFALLLHECVDMGVKETIFTRWPGTMNWRWWLEGLADYCSHQSCRKHQPGAFEFARKGYIEKLSSFSGPAIDLVAEATWFPKGYTEPGDVNHAYAASHYMIAQLVARHGEDWIGKALRQYRRELEKNPDPDFIAILKALTGEDVRGLVRKVKADDVRKFATSLEDAPARR